MNRGKPMLSQSETSKWTDEITEQLKILLEEVKGIPGLAKELTASTDIVNDVQLDSIEMINFMLKIEESLKVEIDFEQLDFSYLQSLSAFADFLSRMKRLA